MMFKNEILENERRHEIYEYIRKNPGLHIRELQRKIGIPLASLQYHLNYMTRRDVIIEEKSEHYTRYYCSKLDSEVKRMLTILRQKRLRDIVMLILVSNKAKYQTLVEALGLPASTVSFYIKCLLENDVIERTKIGYENIYTLKEEDKIGKVLIIYQSTFVDKIVDRWANTWFENHPTKDKPQKEKNT
jgi:predicted transcriptional regulator